MHQPASSNTRHFGLLASGSSGRWEVTVNESTTGDECLLELSGRSLYLTILLRDLAKVSEIRELLHSRLTSRPARRSRPPEVRLGMPKQGRISLIADDEESPRCFLVFGRGDSTVRITLDAEDIGALVAALDDVLRELKNDADEQAAIRQVAVRNAGQRIVEDE